MRWTTSEQGKSDADGAPQAASPVSFLPSTPGFAAPGRPLTIARIDKP